MQVEIEHAPATASIDGQRYWFCSDHCRERFTVEPRRFTRPTSPAAEPAAQEEALVPMSVDPVCGMTVKMPGAPHVTDHAGQRYDFCSPGCRTAFLADPDRYTAGSPAAMPADNRLDNTTYATDHGAPR